MSNLKLGLDLAKKINKIKVSYQTRSTHISLMLMMMSRNTIEDLLTCRDKDNLSHIYITYIISFTAVNNLRVMISFNLKMKNLSFKKTNLPNGIQQFSGGARS